MPFMPIVNSDQDKIEIYRNHVAVRAQNDWLKTVFIPVGQGCSGMRPCHRRQHESEGEFLLRVNQLIDNPPDRKIIGEIG